MENNVLVVTISCPLLYDNVFLHIPLAVASNLKVFVTVRIQTFQSLLATKFGRTALISAFSSSGAPQGFLLPAISLYAVPCILKFLCSNTR